MFWNRKPKLRITPEDQIWVEESLSFLKDSLGEERLREVKTVEPTTEFFNRDFDGSEIDAQFILERCMVLMGIPKGKVLLEFYSEENHCLDDGTLLSSSADIMGRSKGAAGTYQKQGGKSIIRIERGQLKHPESLIATISHELAHEKLLGENRIIQNDENLTDLTAIAFGFGIFIANSKFKFESGKGNGFGWKMQSQGYLPEQVSAYAMASLALKKKEISQDYRKYLDTSVATFFEDSLAYIESEEYDKDANEFWSLSKKSTEPTKPLEIIKPPAPVPIASDELKELQLQIGIACTSGDIDVVADFLQKGHSPNFNTIGGTPLTKAVTMGNKDLIDLLRMYGGDINYSDSESIWDMPPLMAACEVENIAMMKYLIGLGTHIDIVAGN